MIIGWELISCLLVLASFAILLVIYPLGITLKKGFILLAVSLILTITLAYYHWGAFFSWQQYRQTEQAQRWAKTLLNKIKSPDELIAKLKARLDNTSASARGWYLLGRLYVNQGQWVSARTAFTKAHQLNSQDEEITIHYANSLWQINQQQFNSAIRNLFLQVLHQNPNQLDALAMLALDAYTAKNYPKAIDYWQRLLKLAPPNSEEALTIRKAIAKAMIKRQV